MFINCKTKSNSLLFLLLLSQLIVPLPAIFTFITKPNNDSVANIPKWKQKAGKWVTEDFGLANQFCLVVCDGVGGSPFNSQYSAKYVASAILNKITEKQLEQVIATDNILTADSVIIDDVATNVFDNFLKYNEIVTQAFKEYTQFLAQDTSDPNHTTFKENIDKSTPLAKQKILAASTTYISLHLSENQGKPVINFLQMGDSVAMVFLKIKHEDSFFYIPKLITKEMQSQPNTPIQLNTFETGTMINKVLDNVNDTILINEFKYPSYVEYFYDNSFDGSIQVSEDAILLLGSDGLYDNIPTSLITVIVNYVLKYLEAYKYGSYGDAPLLSPSQLITDLVDEYIFIVQQSNELVLFKQVKDYINKMNLRIKPTVTDYPDRYPSMFREWREWFLAKQNNQAATNNMVEEDRADQNRTVEHTKAPFHIFEENGRASVEFESVMDFQSNNKIQIDTTKQSAAQQTMKTTEKRVLMSNMLRSSGCNLLSFYLPNKQSKLPRYDAFNQSTGINNVLKRLAVTTNYLPEFGPDMVAKALAFAARRIIDSGIRVAPFGLKNLQYKNGQVKPGVKPDDVTAIVSMIQNKEKAEVLASISPNFNLMATSLEMKQEAVEYLKNMKVG